MNKRRWILLFVVVAVTLVVMAPGFSRKFWAVRSSNSVRRGVTLATELGCFSCHGALGGQGIPDSESELGEVPAWSGGVWMMYVANDEEIRTFILDGERKKSESASLDDLGHAPEAHGESAIAMPAYRDVVSDSELEDLVAAFRVLSGMISPPAESPARSGRDIARTWKCFSCHGPAGSGGYPNPRSFAGFIPGWYGADFKDLVRSREEFENWVRQGSIPRLTENPIAAPFIRRQRVSMPTYDILSAAEIDDLWSYTVWLKETEGGYRGEINPW